MADEIKINGVGHGSEPDVDEDGSESPVVALIQKVESLEVENAELARGNDEVRQMNAGLVAEIESLKGDEDGMRVEMEGMRVEIESAEDERRAMESIAKRAVDLETEVVRLQHDLISATQEAEEVSEDVAELRRVVDEKEERIAGLEIEADRLRNGKEESEAKARELEREVEVLLVKETEKVSSEMELREKMEEKDGFVSVCKKKVEAMEAEVGKSKVELEKTKKEKILLEDALKESEERGKKLKQMMIELQNKFEMAESVMGKSKEMVGDAVNGSREATAAVNGKCLIGLKDHWHMVAIASAGAIAATAVMAHVYFAKRQS